MEASSRVVGMQIRSEQGTMHLAKMLEVALHRQQAGKLQPYKPVANAAMEVGPELRNEIVRWLAQLNREFRFYPETFALSASILDRFLHAVKVRPKYLRCIGVACFYLAAKTLEEDEVIPETLDLVRNSRCGCTISEVMRMERIILDKLGWSLHAVTPLDFLHIFHALVMSRSPRLLDRCRQMTASRQLGILMDKMEKLIGCHVFLAYPPATLAVALISLELELFAPDWLAITIGLQSMAEVDSDSLIHCREQMSRYLVSLNMGNTIYLYMPTVPVPSSTKPTKRKVEQLEDDNIYEGIKRLYNEDDQGLATSCGFEACQDNKASPPMQAVAN